MGNWNPLLCLLWGHSCWLNTDEGPCTACRKRHGSGAWKWLEESL